MECAPIFVVAVVVFVARPRLLAAPALLAALWVLLPPRSSGRCIRAAPPIPHPPFDEGEGGGERRERGNGNQHGDREPGPADDVKLVLGRGRGEQGRVVIGEGAAPQPAGEDEDQRADELEQGLEDVRRGRGEGRETRVEGDPAHAVGCRLRFDFLKALVVLMVIQK